nr:C10 family peptidase [Bacteroidota bacterium]
MKTEKITVSLVLLFALSLGLYADHVPVKDAQTVGKNFYWENSRTQNPIAYDAIAPDLFTTETLNGTSLYYVFNINRNDGFIIVAADDNITPVLGYSTTGNWTGQDMPPALEDWLNNYKEQISIVINEQMDGGKNIDQLWGKYKTFNPDQPKSVTVLQLLTTTWGQGQYYNEKCPVDSGGPGDHVPAGCVATAMGQVIKHHGHPSHGIGSRSYTLPPYGNLSADFGATTYSYDSMPNAISSSNSHVAQLIYHCGVSVEMEYGPGRSGADVNDARDALVNYFGYSNNAILLSKNDTTDAAWEIMLVMELNASRPLFYCGEDSTGKKGHAFVCDGYKITYFPNIDFHFNWGWGGSCDGYYHISSLIPSPAPYDFTYNQAAIFGLYPVALPPTINYDYGDAPGPGYRTKFANNGARHDVPASGPICYMGSSVDTEPDGQPHIYCLGDDRDLIYTSAYDDEDGVSIPLLTPGQTDTIWVVVNGTGYLNAWMDFNQDGDWNDVGEQIFTDEYLDPLSFPFNPQYLSLTVPASATIGCTYARFRYSSYIVPGGSYYGHWADGEVEDYFVRIVQGDSVPLPPYSQNLLFSLDIGSDTELSDPLMDGDEVFDPGDAYLYQGTKIPFPGTDGYFDDFQAFGYDPSPDGGIQGTGAPCLRGGPVGWISTYIFDMDGLDIAECDLRNFQFGQQMPSIPKFSDPYIHDPDSMLISFDDDDDYPFTHYSGDIPMAGNSFKGQIYGQLQNMDEILKVNVNPIAPPQVSVQSVVPKFDEAAIHANLTPDPLLPSAFPNVDDDDVDALDVPCQLNDSAYTYFSADHEATGNFFAGFPIPLNPGSIYLAENGAVSEVINAQTDIGLPDSTDIDAFEFTWMMDPSNGYVALAMIFSVDVDDPTTSGDESGGLKENKLYITFMTGNNSDFADSLFYDDIDAIALYGAHFGCTPPTNLSASN